MKNYIIHCNEEQLRLMRSAVELQMRVRLGQGFELVDNMIAQTTSANVFYKEVYGPVFDALLKNIIAGPYRMETSEPLAETRNEERDMWISLRNAILARNDAVAIGKYGFMRIEEVEE